MKILVIEDDEPTAKQLSRLLATHNYLVTIAQSGEIGLELARTSSYDLIILDIILPDLDGFSICSQLRILGLQMPILMVTVRGNRVDLVQGLEMGADDYLVKPFDETELLARIRALLRRGSAIISSVIAWENLRLNLDSQEVTYQSTVVRLTPKEYGLLELFLRNPRRIFSRIAILDRVWAIGDSPGEEAVRTQIMGLRQKLRAAGMTTDCIETVYGLGYRLRANPAIAGEDTESTPLLSNNLSLMSSSISAVPQTLLALGSDLSSVNPEVQRSIDQAWRAFQPELQQILQQFEQVIKRINDGTLQEEQRQSAKFAAHRLVGSLGSLGLSEGSAIARQIETALDSNPNLGSSLTEHLQQLKQLIQTRSFSQSAPTTPAPPLRLLLIDQDADFAQQLQQTSSSSGLQIIPATNLNEVEKLLSQQLPDVVALDLTFPDLADDSFSFLEALSQQYPNLPIIVMTVQNRLSDRLMAARYGSCAFVQKPIAAERLMQIAAQSLQPIAPDSACLLVVDDDPVILNHISTLLQPWGVEVVTLQEPENFWDILEATTPSLLILDVEMPNFSGADLCQVVRNDPRWSDIPILMLSAHRDTATVCQLFALGADDYVSKPIVEPELVARVLNRLERTSTRNRPFRATSTTYVNRSRANSSPASDT